MITSKQSDQHIKAGTWLMKNALDRGDMKMVRLIGHFLAWCVERQIELVFSRGSRRRTHTSKVFTDGCEKSV
jgi:hypothetical protein